MLGSSERASVRSEEVVWEPGRGVVAEALFGRRVLFLGAARARPATSTARACGSPPKGSPIAVLGIRESHRDARSATIRGSRCAARRPCSPRRLSGASRASRRSISTGVAPADCPTSRLRAAAPRAHEPAGDRDRSRASGARISSSIRRRARRRRRSSRRGCVVSVEDPKETAMLDLATVGLRSGRGTEPRGLRVVRQNYRGRSETLLGPSIWSATSSGRPPWRGSRSSVFSTSRSRETGARDAVSWLEGRGAQEGGAASARRTYSQAERAARRRHGLAAAAHPVLVGNAAARRGEVGSRSSPVLAGASRSTDGRRRRRISIGPSFGPIRSAPTRRCCSSRWTCGSSSSAWKAGTKSRSPSWARREPGASRGRRDVLPRAVAAFNGAFKAEHGAYGMMVGKRLLLPPVPGAATVVVTQRPRRRASAPGPRPRTFPPTCVVSAEPRSAGRRRRRSTQRGVTSGVASGGRELAHGADGGLPHAAGHVYYAWGRDISGPGLGASVEASWLRLRDSPRHESAALRLRVHARDAPRTEASSLRARRPGDEHQPEPLRARFGQGFLLCHAPEPLDPPTRRATSGSAAGVAAAAGLAPRRCSRRRSTSGTSRFGSCRFDAGRVDWIVRAGSEEPAPPGGEAKKIGLEPELEGRVSRPSGSGTRPTHFDMGSPSTGKPRSISACSYATLVLAAGESPRILARRRSSVARRRTRKPFNSRCSRTAASSMPASSDRGGTRVRGALCVTPVGRVLVAVAKHDSSDPLASVLIEPAVGGSSRSTGGRVIRPSFTAPGHREPPLDRYDVSVLYVLGRSMTPHAFRWRN